MREGLENPLDDFTSLAQQLEQIGVIGRCEYLETTQLLLSAFQISAGAFAQAASNFPSTSKDFRLHEGQPYFQPHHFTSLALQLVRA